MYSIITDNTGKEIKIWNEKVTIESSALTQAREMSNLPIVSRVALMPDAHMGKGACVGSVVATKKAVIPSAVGVDIGCGMIAVKLSLKAHQLPDSLKSLRDQIEASIPVGQDEHDDRRLAQHADPKTKTILNKRFKKLESTLDLIIAKHPGIEKIIYKGSASAKAWKQLGSLGGGNHFIELCVSTTDDVWLMIHSGSRKIGNAIGTYFIEKARKEMERVKIHLPNADLAYLEDGSIYYDDYLEAISWAQDYAKENRDVMVELALNVLRRTLPPFEVTEEVVNCHHNYLSEEEHDGEELLITRKGAVSAKEGEMGIIPGSMGTKSYIVRGKGSKDSMCSCSHGAGRTMGRGQANKTITLDQHIAATEGVECRKDEGVLDESPAAYKDIDAVIESQLDLIEVVHTLKQVLCIKG